MNWAALGKGTGWLPGATLGTLLGGLAAWLYWDSEAAPTCASSVISSISVNCVHIALGEFTDFKSLLLAFSAIGGVIGAICTGYQAHIKAGS